MKDIIFIADFFSNQHTGGAELHDDVVIKYFNNTNRLFAKVNTSNLTEQFIEDNLNKTWFISNFVGLRNTHKAILAKKCKYLIYEHDYKFIDARNPIFFEDFKVPQKNFVNLSFYQAAKKIICLSKMHRDIFDKNLQLDNIVNINCSMWHDEDLELFESLQNQQKIKKFAVIESNNKIKKTKESVEFCKKNNLDYDLISSQNYTEFINLLSKYSGLIFMTGHPEPTPRVAIEAKMLNMKFISQKDLIGVAHEKYFSLSGQSLIDEVKNMRDEALEKIIGWIDEA